MRKNLSSEEGKKICLPCLSIIYSFLTENISSRTSEWTQGRSRIYFLG